MYRSKGEVSPYRDWPSWYMKGRQSSLSVQLEVAQRWQCCCLGQPNSAGVTHQTRVTSAAALPRARIGHCQTDPQLPKPHCCLHPLGVWTHRLGILSGARAKALIFSQGQALHCTQALTLVLNTFWTCLKLARQGHWQHQRDLGTPSHGLSEALTTASSWRALWSPDHDQMPVTARQAEMLADIVTCTALRAAGVQWPCPGRHSNSPVPFCRPTYLPHMVSGQ